MNGYEFLDATERRQIANGKPIEPPARRPIQKLTLAELCAAHPKLNPPIIDGLAREGELINVNAPPKFGKSWLGYGLGLSVVCGRPWLDQFATTSGKVLLLDNELHAATIAHRIPMVGDAMGLPREQYDVDFEVWPMRGNMRTLTEVALEFEAVEPHEYRLIIFDAKYRFAVAGVSENDNNAETLIYNRLDELAERTRAVLALIHHQSKGGQADKRLTDIGAGAGAQSRAADCHLVLREHEEPGVVVLDAAVRSFAPVEPLALEWRFPLWEPTEADASKLKGRLSAGDQRQADRDREGVNAIVDALLLGPLGVNEIARRANMGKQRAGRLIAKLEQDGQLTPETTTIAHNKATVYRLVEEGGP